MATVQVTVRGKQGKSTRSLTLSERVAQTQATRGKFSAVYVWPVPVPVYDKGEEADARRTRNYFDALGEADTMLSAIADALGKGHRVSVTVESGAILTADKDQGVYANVIGQQMIKEICEAADSVKIEAGAEDPRDWVSED